MEKENIKNLIKYVLKHSYREEIRRLIRKSRYQKVSYGELYPDKTILLIRRDSTAVGIFSDFIVFLYYIEIAIQKNWIPVIDRKNNKTIMLNNVNLSKNTWELFFEQPFSISVEEVEDGYKNVMICYVQDICNVSLLMCKNYEIIDYWRMIAKNYIRFNKNTIEKLEEKRELYFAQKGKILGVAIREGYTKIFQTNKGKMGIGHAFQANMKTILEDTKYYMQEWECNSIFLSCQNEETISYFKNALPKEALIYTERMRWTNNTLPEGSVEITKHGYAKIDQAKHAFEYVLDVYLLSVCDAFLCSENSGSEAAFIMNKKLKYLSCYNLGRFRE